MVEYSPLPTPSEEGAACMTELGQVLRDIVVGDDPCAYCGGSTDPNDMCKGCYDKL